MKEIKLRQSRLLLGVLVAGALALGVAACGGGDDSGTTTAASGNVTPEAQDAIDAGFKGTFEPPPTESPKPEAGKNVWVIQLGNYIDLTQPGGVIHTAKKIGWKPTLCDGKFSTATTSNCIGQAIADKADGIALFVIDCTVVKSSLQQAKAAGIPVVASVGVDCNEVKEGEPPLFAAQTTYTDPTGGIGLSWFQFMDKSYGPIQAAALINGTEGKLKLLNLVQTDAPATVAMDVGVRKALEELCPDCEIVKTLNHAGTDIGAGLQQKVAQALVQHPEANGVVTQSAVASENVAAAIKAAGRTDTMYSVTAEGLPSTIERIRSNGGINAGAGLALDAGMLALLDALNRLFHGETVPEGGVGFPDGNGTQIYDEENNLPPEGGQYEPPIDYLAAYLKAWGISD